MKRFSLNVAALVALAVTSVALANDPMSDVKQRREQLSGVRVQSGTATYLDTSRNPLTVNSHVTSSTGQAQWTMTFSDGTSEVSMVFTKDPNDPSWTFMYRTIDGNLDTPPLLDEDVRQVTVGQVLRFKKPALAQAEFTASILEGKTGGKAADVALATPDAIPTSALGVRMVLLPENEIILSFNDGSQEIEVVASASPSLLSTIKVPDAEPQLMVLNVPPGGQWNRIKYQVCRRLYDLCMNSPDDEAAAHACDAFLRDCVGYPWNN